MNSSFAEIKEMVKNKDYTPLLPKDSKTNPLNSYGPDIVKHYNENLPKLIDKLRENGASSALIKSVKSYLFGSRAKEMRLIMPSFEEKREYNVKLYNKPELESLETRLTKVENFLNNNTDKKNLTQAYEILRKTVGLDSFLLPSVLQEKVPEVLNYINIAKDKLTQVGLTDQLEEAGKTYNAIKSVAETAVKKAVTGAIDSIANDEIDKKTIKVREQAFAAGDNHGQQTGFSKAKEKYNKRKAEEEEVPKPPEHEPDPSKKEIAKIEDVVEPEKKAQMTIEQYINGLIVNDAFEVPEEKLREGIKNAVKNKLVDIPPEQVETVINKVYLDSLVQNQKLNEAARRLGFSNLPKAVQQRLKNLHRTDVENRKYKLFKKIVPKESSETYHGPSEENVQKITEFEDFYKNLNPLLLRGIVRRGHY